MRFTTRVFGIFPADLVTTSQSTESPAPSVEIYYRAALCTEVSSLLVLLNFQQKLCLPGSLHSCGWKTCSVLCGQARHNGFASLRPSLRGGPVVPYCPLLASSVGTLNHLSSNLFPCSHKTWETLPEATDTSKKTSNGIYTRRLGVLFSKCFPSLPIHLFFFF